MWKEVWLSAQMNNWTDVPKPIRVHDHVCDVSVVCIQYVVYFTGTAQTHSFIWLFLPQCLVSRTTKLCGHLCVADATRKRGSFTNLFLFMSILVAQIFTFFCKALHRKYIYKFNFVQHGPRLIWLPDFKTRVETHKFESYACLSS